MSNNFFPGLFVILIITLMVSGCVNSDTNVPMQPTVSISSTSTLTIVPTSNPLITLKIIDPIVGTWTGIPDKGSVAAYCQFFENGDLKWSTSLGRDTNIIGAAHEIRIIEENKLFGFDFNPTPDNITRIGSGGYRYVPNATGSEENFQNLSWVRIGNDPKKEVYLIKKADGSKLTDVIFYGDSMIFNSTGLRLERTNNLNFN